MTDFRTTCPVWGVHHPHPIRCGAGATAPHPPDKYGVFFFSPGNFSDTCVIYNVQCFPVILFLFPVFAGAETIFLPCLGISAAPGNIKAGTGRADLSVTRRSRHPSETRTLCGALCAEYGRNNCMTDFRTIWPVWGSHSPHPIRCRAGASPLRNRLRLLHEKDGSCGLWDIMVK